MIIGLHGAKEAGKDTVAAMLVKEYGYERRAFADPLKKSVAALFNIPFSVVDKFKLDDKVVVEVRRELYGEGSNDHDLLARHTFREFLQRYGTEAHRDVPEMGFDFWVDLTLPDTGYYTNRDIAISDVRFDNEAQRIHDLEGYVVEIVRPGTDNQDQHRSEAGLSRGSIDWTIHNDQDLEHLAHEVEKMVTYYEYH